MTKEEEFVVNPLKKYLSDARRSGAYWKLKHQPAHGRSERGWDLVMERKNRILYIEAKYVRRSFIGSFSSLTTSPLTNRHKHGWSHEICWAIGSGWHKNQKMTRRNINQILFDYLARHLNFWKHYSKDLNVGHVYFVSNKKVAVISFNRILKIASSYNGILKKQNIDINKTDIKTSEQKRKVVENLMKNIKYK